MSKFRKPLLIGIAALTLGAGSLSVHAADTQAGATAGRPAPAQEHGKRGEHMKQRMEQRMAELHDKLKLSSDQEGAWRTFAEKMKPGTPPARPDKAEFAKLTAPERMERIHAMMQQREKRMGERVAATKDFYAVLTPEQQKVFNEQFSRGFRHERGHHRHGPR